MIREQDREPLRRIIRSVFITESDHHDELQAIVNDATLTAEQKAEKYIDTIINHLEYVPDTNEEEK